MTAASGGTVQVSGAVSQSAPGSLSTAGPGVVVLSGSNTYSGGTTINQGVLNAGVGNLGSGPLNLSGGTFQPSAPLVSGLTAQYYTGTGANHLNYTSLAAASGYFNGLTLALTNNITANVNSGNFDFGSTGTYFPTGPAPTGIATTTDFAAKYTGYFYAAVTGSYTFNTYSDDDSMLWLTAGTMNNNGDTAVSQNGGASGHGLQNSTNSPVSLTAGTYYPITVGYDQGTGGYGFQVSYTPPGGNMVLLPVSLLYTGTTAAYTMPST